MKISEKVKDKMLTGKRCNLGNGWDIQVERKPCKCFKSFLMYKGTKIISYSNFSRKVIVYCHSFIEVSVIQLKNRLSLLVPLSLSRIKEIKNNNEYLPKHLIFYKEFISDFC